jgi:hypothetical protein
MVSPFFSFGLGGAFSFAFYFARDVPEEIWKDKFSGEIF